MNPQDPKIQSEPVVESTPQTTESPNTTGSKKPNKKLIAILAGIGGLVLVGIIIAIIAALTGVSKADYKTSYDTVKEARDAYSDMSGNISLSANSTEAERKNDLDSLKQSSEKFSSTFEELGEQKAIKRDGEAKKLYEATAAKKEKFDNSLAGITEAYEYILPAVNKLNTVSTTNRTAGIGEAEVAFKDIQTKVKDSNNKELVDALVPLLGKYKDLAAKVDAYRADFKLYDSAVSSEFSTTNRAVSEAVRNWSSNMKKSSSDAEIKDEFNALGEYLTQKASGN